MKVEIISREYIKPSSPSPLHLKCHKLCLLDQIHSHHFVPTFFFYPMDLCGEIDIDHIVSKRKQLLKQSLSETLLLFYPVAGKITGDFSIDCNDEGVYVVEAKAQSSLNEFLMQPDLKVINKFYPDDAKDDQDRQIAGCNVAKIQVTSFSCGGLVICACISHLFGDATTFATFMKSWAATARNNNDQEPLPFRFDASSLFPIHDPFPIELTWQRHISRFCKTGRNALRRFVFDAEAIASLKAKAATACLQNPSRFEVVSALISKCIMAAFKTKSGTHEPTLLTNFVNMRRRAKPQLSDHLIGNIIWHVNTLCTDDNLELGDLAWKFREATMEVDGHLVQSLQGDGGFHNISKAFTKENKMYSDVKHRIIVSSWITMGFYEINYGWGKPIWMGMGTFDASVVEPPTFFLAKTSSGDGIEVWVHLVEEYMALLEVNKELLAFSTLDPCPLEQPSSISLHL